jgi:ubiquinone/menaquinone biosynthesis C-methylase UbiE
MNRLSRSRIVIVAGMSATIVALAVSWGKTQTTAPAAKTDPKINEPFKKPDLKAFIKKFESDEREVYARRHEIVAALGLTPGMAVADIGAGTGLFTRLFADKVGKGGKVFAVDIAPRFLAHIASEAKKHGQSQVATIQGNQDSTNLPADSVDLAFLCDVYHHLENPEKTLAAIRQALKPEGKLVVIDFDRVEGRSEDFVLKHVRAGKEVFQKEIEAAGFVRAPSNGSPALKENFWFCFEKSSSSLRRSRRDQERIKETREQNPS